MNKNYEVIELNTGTEIAPTSGANVWCPGIGDNNVCVEINVFCEPHDWFCGPVTDHSCYGNNPHCPTSIGNGNRY